MAHWLDTDCDVHALDNWSTDGTFEMLRCIAARQPTRVTLERFPEAPSAYYEWSRILRRKEEIASAFPGRWIIHSDSDELRAAPWPDLSFARALAVAEAYGANRVDFTLLNFRPTTDGPFQGVQTLRYFEYGTRPGHFLQKKAWRQPLSHVTLARSGGHVAEFDGAIDFPYKFIIKHYPIRSRAHGQQKVFIERNSRWDPAERTAGWHLHYDEFDQRSDFVWDPATLKHFDGQINLDEVALFISDLSRPERWSASE